jgi:hypothetical protein
VFPHNSHFVIHDSFVVVRFLVYVIGTESLIKTANISQTEQRKHVIHPTIKARMPDCLKETKDVNLNLQNLRKDGASGNAMQNSRLN